MLWRPRALARCLFFLAISGTAAAQSNPEYPPLSSAARWSWFADETVVPSSLAGGLFSAGFGTLIDQPKEYGTQWEGFGERYGMWLAGTASSNAMEAGIGALWGEDPRYFPATGQPFRTRIGHIVKYTLYGHESRRSDGSRVRTISGHFRKQLSLKHLARPQRGYQCQRRRAHRIRFPGENGGQHFPGVLA